MTHFARADDEVGVGAQLARFKEPPGSTAGQPRQLGGLLRFPEATGQIVRPGIMLYGGSRCPTCRAPRPSACVR
jgi:alanine racemase